MAQMGSGKKLMALLHFGVSLFCWICLSLWCYWLLFSFFVWGLLAIGKKHNMAIRGSDTTTHPGGSPTIQGNTSHRNESVCRLFSELVG